jgi:hypothetical protein
VRNVCREWRSRQREFEVGLDALPVACRQPGPHGLDPPVVLLDVGPVLPDGRLIPRGLVAHPLPPYGLVDVVPVSGLLEFHPRVGDTALVACAATEQSAQGAWLSRCVVLPCRRSPRFAARAEVPGRRLVTPDKACEIDNGGTIKTLLEDRRESRQVASSGLIELLRVRLTGLDRGLLLLTFGGLLRRKIGTLPALLLARLLTSPLFMVIASLCHACPLGLCNAA